MKNGDSCKIEKVGKFMKVMIISDIHGSLEAVEQVMFRYEQEKAEKLLILGDFSNYGNSPFDTAIAEILNEKAEQIIAVRGNGDGFEIEDLLNFQLEDIRNIDINGLSITMTHGHLYRKTNLPHNCGKIFLQGHSHCAEITKMEEKIIANPGSISKPRNGAQASYMILDDKKIQLKNLFGEILQQMEV